MQQARSGIEPRTVSGVVMRIHVTPSVHGGVVKLPLYTRQSGINTCSLLLNIFDKKTVSLSRIQPWLHHHLFKSRHNTSTHTRSSAPAMIKPHKLRQAVLCMPAQHLCSQRKTVIHRQVLPLIKKRLQYQTWEFVLAIVHKSRRMLALSWMCDTRPTSGNLSKPILRVQRVHCSPEVLLPNPNGTYFIAARSMIITQVSRMKLVQTITKHKLPVQKQSHALPTLPLTPSPITHDSVSVQV